MSSGLDRYVWERALLDDPAVNGTELLVLLVLATYVNRKSGSARPSQHTLAESCGVDERTIRRHLDAAESRGYLTRGQRGCFGRATVLTIALPRTVELTHEDTSVLQDASDLKDANALKDANDLQDTYEDTYEDTHEDTHEDAGVLTTMNREQEQQHSAVLRTAARTADAGCAPIDVTRSTSDLIDEWLCTYDDESRPPRQRVVWIRRYVSQALANGHEVDDVRDALLDEDGDILVARLAKR